MIQTPGEIHSGYFGHPGRQRSGVFCPGINRTAMISHIIADVFRSRHWLFKTKKTVKAFLAKKGGVFFERACATKKLVPRTVRTSSCLSRDNYSKHWCSDSLKQSQKERNLFGKCGKSPSSGFTQFPRP